MGQSSGNKTGGAKPSGNGKGKGSSGNGFFSGTSGYKPGGSFWDFQAKPVAGVNPLLGGAASAVGGIPTAGAGFFGQANDYLKKLAGSGAGYYNDAINAARRGVGTSAAFNEARNLGSQMSGVAGRQITGETLRNDPAIKEAMAQFNKYSLPMIQSQAAQMGLGRSNTLANASSVGQAKTLLPLLQQGLQREENTRNALASSLGSRMNTAMGIGNAELGSRAQDLSRYIGALQGAAGQEASNLGNAYQGMMGLGQQQGNQLMQGINTANQIGTQMRGIEQEKLDAPYNEQQRLWAEALNSMYGPLSFLGNMGGATSTTSKK